MKKNVFLFSMVGICMVVTSTNSNKIQEIQQLMSESKTLVSTTTKNHLNIMQGYERFEAHLAQGYADNKLSLDELKNIIKALNFATEKHQSQTRKDDAQTPYIIHPIGVADSIMTIGQVYDSKVLIGALLHDTVEDTNTTIEEISKTFGITIEAYVRELSDNKTIPKPDRKRMQVIHAPYASLGATIIKLADKLYNLNDVIQNPPSYWPIKRRNEYIRWAQEVVDNLPAVNEPLKKAIFETIRAYHEGRVQ